jgi:hypothetical protein
MNDTTIVETVDFGDWDEEQDKIDKGIEPGDYEVTLQEWKYGVSRVKQSPQISFYFRVVNNEEADGTPIWYNSTWGTVFFKKAIIACARAQGMDPVQLDLAEATTGPGGGNGTTDFLDGLQGASVNVRLKEKEYQGKKSCEIADFLR